jgi:thiosulfate reductase cytochrome b subunit
MSEPEVAPVPAPSGPLPASGLVRRHRLSTRGWHWTNVVAVTVMLMSGLMIFNAHPRLYWGSCGANPDHAWLEITSRGNIGEVRIAGLTVETTGVLGVFRNANGQLMGRAFPDWMTIPSYYSLADARLWHLAFAWLLAFALLAYLLWSLVNRHISGDLHITRREWSPAHLWQDIKDHARLKFPVGEAVLRYNILQKLAYCSVLFVLLPLVILTGMTMSPGLDAGFPFLPDLFGGRQSARSLHFIAAFGLVAFFVVHIIMVVLAGPINEVRSMVTGWYRVPSDRKEAADA